MCTAITRDGKVIKRVKLSIYGNAATTIPRSGGGAKYAVVMAKTNDNFVGSAAFTGSALQCRPATGPGASTPGPETATPGPWPSAC